MSLPSSLTDGSVDLSIVVPTFNEKENIRDLVAGLDAALSGVRWEVIFVDDDSPDGTASVVRELARSDRRVRCIQRIGRRGLSTACVEGMLASSAPYLAVMDADLQHDETVLPAMLDLLKQGTTDLAVGTRYASGGSTGVWNPRRVSMSRFATTLSRFMMRVNVSDPMSGFFMLRRQTLDDTVRQLSGIGFKILLDIIASSPSSIRIAEVPYTFRNRHAGVSKLDSVAVWEYGMLLADKMVGRYVPIRFLSFAVVGGLGVLVHFAVLTIMLQGFHTRFPVSQGSATFVAMVFNFTVNNALTYRDRRLHGLRWLSGLATFILACSIGAFANVGIATYLFETRVEWVLAALSGVIVGAVWNYVVTQVYTWGHPHR